MPHDATSVRLTRHRLIVALRSDRQPEALVEDAALVISELVGNAVRYGLPFEDGSVRVGWQSTRDGVVLEVSDGGVGPVCDAIRPEQTREGGRGLLLVDAVSIEWGVEVQTGCSAVWVRLAARTADRLTATVG